MSKIKIMHVHIFSFIAISLLCCLQIRALDYIYILNDEFGYWAHAISAVGYDWKDLISETPYYSWGYSIWLVPIVALLPTPELWYKAAILLNVFFLLLSYVFCYKSGRKLFPEVNEKAMALISLIVIIYPSNIAYAQIAWSESLSYLLVWVGTYLILKLDETFSNKYFIALLFTLLYSYAVHNRNIGILLAGIITIISLLIKHKKKIWYYIMLPVILIGGYKGIDLVKAHQINTLWSNSKTSSVNNVGINTATIVSYTSRIINGITSFCTSMLGKYLYILIGFELTFPIVIIRFAKNTLSNIKDKCVFRNYFCSKLWALLAAIFMFGLCALQMNSWAGRKDFIVYGRYMENSFGPLLLLAISGTILYINDAKTALFISLASILMGIFPVFYYMDNASGKFNFICSPIIGVFCKLADDTPKAFILLGLFLTFILVLIYIATSLKTQRLRVMLIILCFGLTYSSMGCLLSKHFADRRLVYDSMRISLREKISGELAELELYYVKDQESDSYCTKPKYLQYAIPDRTIHVILPEEIANYLEQDVILMTDPNDETSRAFLVDHDAQLIDNNYLLAVYSTNK